MSSSSARTRAHCWWQSLSDAQLGLPAPPMGADGPPRTVEQMIEGQMIRHYHEHRENIEPSFDRAAKL